MVVQEPGGHLQHLPVVAGGVPEQKFVGDPEFVRGLGGAAVFDAAGPQDLHHGVVGTAVGVGHARHGVMGVGFEGLPVLPDLAHDLGPGQPLQKGMGEGVEGDLVPGVKFGDLLQIHLDGGVVQQPCVEVKGPLEAVVVEDLHQTAVEVPSVVIAQSQGFGPPSGKDDIDAHRGKGSFYLLPAGMGFMMLTGFCGSKRPSSALSASKATRVRQPGPSMFRSLA